MKRLNYINMLIAVLALGTASPAQAGWFWSSDQRDPDFKPYLTAGKQDQNAQWRQNDWTVADWAPNAQAGGEQMDAFFRAGILIDYDNGGWGGDPTLIVGPGFYHLSGYDQRRVLSLFDYLYEVTAGGPDKKGTVLSLKDWHTGHVIGVYSRSGLQLS
jgi:hypothetical protein